MSEMDWQQKFMAIKAVSPFSSVCMRLPGDWYVQAGMHIGGDGLLVGNFGNGATPQEAIEAHWDIYTSVPITKYVVCSSGGIEIRVRWNGFMWEHIAKPLTSNKEGTQ